MKFIRNLSFRRKLFVYASLISFFSLLIACGAFMVLEVSFFRTDMLKKVATEGNVIAKSSSSALVFFDSRYAKEIIGGLDAQHHVTAACIYSENGKIFAEYVRGNKKFEFPAAPDRETHKFGKNSLEVFRDITFDDDKVGTLYIRANLEELNERVLSYLTIIAGVMAVSLFAAMVFSSFVLRFISKPVLELVETAKEVSETKDYSIRASKINEDELGVLTDAFNHMLDQVESGVVSLRESEAMMLAILNAITGALALVSPDGTLHVINNNGAGRFEKTPEEVVGKNLLDLYPEYFAAERRTQFQQVANTGQPLEYQYEIDDKSYESAIYPVFDEHGKVVKLALYARDISNRIQAEKEKDILWRQLQQAQKMEAVGQLAGGMAHDFNNMLAVIMMSAEQALHHINGNEKVRKYISSVLNATNRAKDLSTKLLTFSRQGKLDIRCVSVASIFDEIMPVLERTFNKNIQITRNIQKDVLLNVDENQIFQSLVNICNNARDAMPDGGTLSIDCSVQCCSDIPHTSILFEPVPFKKCCVIKISDTGTGIPQEYVNKIFEPFFTSKDIGKGTGLGLSITHGIIKNHKGSIHVNTEMGVGTTFTILLPNCSEIDVEQPLVESVNNVSNSTDGAILIVDDELPILETFASALEDNGYRVYTTSVSSEAQELLKQHKHEIALVILDVLMPGMNGREVYEQLIEIDENIKVIFSSGYSPENGISELINSENIEFIQKPFSLEMLYEKVSKILN